MNFIMVNWLSSSALCFNNYKSKDSNGEKLKYYCLPRENPEIQSQYNIPFEPMDLIGMMDIYVLFTGVLGKEKTYMISLIFQFQKISLRPATLLKKRLWHRCFPVNFARFFGTLFLQNTSGRLLLFL